MIKYESHFKELRFHVDGVLHKFDNGVYVTDDKKVQEHIEQLQYVNKVEEIAQEDGKPKRSRKKNTPTEDEAAE